MKSHSHYYKDVSKLELLDIYRIIELYEVTDSGLQHIVKKALCAGKRGAKDFRTDLENIRDTVVRRIEMLDEDEELCGSQEESAPIPDVINFGSRWFPYAKDPETRQAIRDLLDNKGPSKPGIKRQFEKSMGEVNEMIVAAAAQQGITGKVEVKTYGDYKSIKLEDGSTLTASGPVEAMSQSGAACEGPGSIIGDPHHDLRKTWKFGQRWQCKSHNPVEEWTDMGPEGPGWASHILYRRHPEDTDQYATTEESKAALSPYTRKPAEKQLDAMVEEEVESKGYDLHSVNEVQVLRSIAMRLIEGRADSLLDNKESPWYPEGTGEWIEWGGEDCPVAPKTAVHVLLDHERESREYEPSVASAKCYFWGKPAANNPRIVAYQIVHP